MIVGVINVVQALFTELDPDEAYYWIYSQELDWGYFDHPAGVAVAIKAGTAIFQSTLGIRLLPIILMLGSIYLLWLMLDKPQEKENINLFALLVLAMPMLHVYGF
ncbi:MAG: 4-amino-4-deoxy-L-arabinose transferase, partial [Bacteroidota bacterium]